MNRFIERIARSSAHPATLLIRLLVGGIFVSEGIQKFLYADRLGAGRMAKIGLPAPEILGPFVGTVELTCGLLVLLGLLTRLAVLPLIATMVVALVTTKLPILLGTGFAGFALRDLPYYGLLSMLHESRTDLSMLTCSVFLLIVGAGPLSLDARLATTRTGKAVHL